MDFLKGGRGIAFGKPATTANLFDVGMATNISENLSVGGNLTISGITNANSSMVLNGKYVYFDSENITESSPPTSGQTAGNSRVQLRDSANVEIAQIFPLVSSSGETGITLQLDRSDGDSDVHHWLRLYLAADGTPRVNFTNNAVKNAWLDALGLTVENRTLTPNTSNVTMQGENYARSFGNVVQLNLVFTTNKQIPTWDNQNFVVGTMDRPCAYSKQYMTAIAQINSQWTLMQAGVNGSGEVRLRTVGTAIPSGTWVWVFGTYISA